MIRYTGTNTNLLTQTKQCNAVDNTATNYYATDRLTGAVELKFNLTYTIVFLDLLVLQCPAVHNTS